MIEDKLSIIESEGANLLIKKPDGTETQTRGLLGRATKPGNSAGSLEANRKCIVPPSVNLENGDLIENLDVSEHYLVIATLNEVIDNQLASIVSFTHVTNAFMDIFTEIEAEDDVGNLIKVPEMKYNELPVYIKHVDATMRQYDPGISVDTSFLIYSTAVNIDTLDKIVTEMGGYRQNMKAEFVDYMSYPGISIIHVSNETRR